MNNSSKNSILLCSLLALGGAARAQSSVTLYGTVDASISYGKGSVSSLTQMSSGNLAASRWGIRGVEDLGGGLKAGFSLEAGFTTDNGLGQGTNIDNTPTGSRPGPAFNRLSYLSLSHSNWGELRFGRDYVPQYLNMWVGDVFGNVGVGMAANYQVQTPLLGPTVLRASNMVTYITPSTLGGFALQASHYFGENAGSDDGNGDAARLSYSRGPLVFGIAYGRTKYSVGAARERNVAASWDFGLARLMGSYTVDDNANVRGHGGAVGVEVPLGQPHVIKASYSNYKTNAAGSPSVNKFALGYVYTLSKRTALYATAAYVNNGGQSALGLNGSVTAPGKSSTGVDLGFKHAF